jgi:CheY-like chemotaxis protein
LEKEKVWYGVKGETIPSMKNVLIVDDNDFYADIIAKELQDKGATTTRAKTATEGIEILSKNMDSFDGVVSDICMESEFAGLRVLRYCRDNGYKGVVTVATTALDMWIGFVLIKPIYKNIYKCHYMIPKRPIINDENIIWIKGIEKN